MRLSVESSKNRGRKPSGHAGASCDLDICVWPQSSGVYLDGYRNYLAAIVTHSGCWVHPPRRQATGPAPKPRWMPLPELLYAQVVKTMRRRRIVGVKHRVVFGTQAAVDRILPLAAGRSIRRL